MFRIKKLSFCITLVVLFIYGLVQNTSIGSKKVWFHYGDFQHLEVWVAVYQVAFILLG